jgi:hypothetical protein
VAQPERGFDRLRDIGDVNAVGDVTRLVDAVGAAGEQPYKRILAGAVDAAEPQDGDRDVALPPERLPVELGFDPRAAALMPWNGRGRFIDPGAAVVAVDAGR